MGAAVAPDKLLEYPLGDVAMSHMLAAAPQQQAQHPMIETYNKSKDDEEDYGFENEKEWLASKAVNNAAQSAVLRLKLK